jgi:hypothetical protein
MQSRLMSMVEAWVNVAVGLGLAYAMNFTLLASFGTPISHRQNMIMTAIMTAVSLARSYTLRRLFNRARRQP